jgi:hypothetical protein
MSFYQFEAEVSSDQMTETSDPLRREQERHWGVILLGCERDENLNLAPSSERAWMLEDGSWWTPQDGQNPPQGAIARPYHGALVRCIEELHRIEDVLEQVDKVFDLFGGNPAQQHLALELLFDRIEQRNGEITGLTLRPWAQRLFLHIAPAAGQGQPPGMHSEGAPDWIRPSTPKKDCHPPTQGTD